MAKAKTSPYFDAKNKAKAAKKKSPNSKAKEKKGSPDKKPKKSRKKKDEEEVGTTSRFFLKSPSSVYGSVTSLGPLICTWIPPDRLDLLQVPPICLRATSTDATSAKKTEHEICSACLPVIEAALVDFSDCLVFKDRGRVMKLTTTRQDKTDLSRLTCVEWVSRNAEANVRHLCQYQCYLRAYCPRREWWLMRTKLTKHLLPVNNMNSSQAQEKKESTLKASNKPMNALLQNWTCQLVPVSVPPLKKVKCPIVYSPPKQEQKVRDKAFLQAPKVVFCNKDTDDDPNLTPTKKLKVKAPKPIDTPTKAIHALEQEYQTNQTKVATVGAAITTIVGNSILHTTNTCRDDRTLATLLHSTTTANANDTMERFRYQLSNCTRINDVRGHYTRPRCCCIYSPLGLLEEILVHDPWKLQLATIFLQRTTRKKAEPIFLQFLERWPSAERVAAKLEDEADLKALIDLLEPLGLHVKRAKGIRKFCGAFCKLESEKKSCYNFTRKDVKKLPYCGEYAADAYQVFIRRDYNTPLQSNDYALKGFVEWQKSIELQQPSSSSSQLPQRQQVAHHVATTTTSMERSDHSNSIMEKAQDCQTKPQFRKQTAGPVTSTNTMITTHRQDQQQIVEADDNAVRMESDNDMNDPLPTLDHESTSSRQNVDTEQPNEDNQQEQPQKMDADDSIGNKNERDDDMVQEDDQLATLDQESSRSDTGHPNDDNQKEQGDEETEQHQKFDEDQATCSKGDNDKVRNNHCDGNASNHGDMNKSVTTETNDDMDGEKMLTQLDGDPRDSDSDSNQSIEPRGDDGCGGGNHAESYDNAKSGSNAPEIDCDNGIFDGEDDENRISFDNDEDDDRTYSRNDRVYSRNLMNDYAEESWDEGSFMEDDESSLSSSDSVYDLQVIACKDNNDHTKCSKYVPRDEFMRRIQQRFPSQAALNAVMNEGTLYPAIFMEPPSDEDHAHWYGRERPPTMVMRGSLLHKPPQVLRLERKRKRGKPPTIIIPGSTFQRSMNRIE
ncbi:Methyl-CpG binding domain protein 4 [Seminavis robusta]|uniref:Methyl-CpG binding domain protein 4 n=1 Tax=Seminavis robusta TaxID=568900 RepID=A0A9N8DWF2_9STRA|nr:Methyl-CpG binding domain protein 4 [Seminavis robusta]|eukprot:Sro403_g135680.1 Methyl-CpG binding domain protein 4 (1006) ;mRNA; f:33306-36323